MKIEQLVSDTLAEHEQLAPDSDRILADVQRRLDRPRTGGWPVALAAAAVLVAGTGVGVSVVRGQHRQPAAADPALSSQTMPGSSTARPSVVRSSAGLTPAATAIKPLTMPFDLGWLPDGPKQYLARRINIGQPGSSGASSFQGEYMLEVTTATGKLDVDVQQLAVPLSDASFKSGPGVATTVNGRPGLESANATGPGGYEIWFQDSVGGVMYVNVAAPEGQSASGTRLASVGRQVAQGVRYPGTSQVPPTFGLGYVPSGLKIQAFDVENVDGQYDSNPARQWTSYNLGTPTSQQSGVIVTSGSVTTPSGKAGRAVQGHRTSYTDEGGYTSLYVLDAVHGGPVLIGGFSPLAELYRIADGLVLPR